jgi:tetratricopeptide (TPR) repeat protein
MILDILAANDWERPVYFASTAPSESYLGLEDYFQVDGLAYRLVPIKTERNDGRPGRVETDILYENVMEKFVWGGLDTSDLYMDENNRRMTISLRLTFSRLAEALLDEGKPDKAKEVLDKCLEAIPNKNVPYDIFSLYIAENFYRLGDYESANALARILADTYEDDLKYYMSLAPKDAELVKAEKNQALAVLQRLYVLAVQQYPQEELGKEFADRFSIYFGQPQQGGPAR